MIPQFDYAFYVWSSYALFALVCLWQFAQPRIRRRRIFEELAEEHAYATGEYNDTDS